jgi:hypothetical protein
MEQSGRSKKLEVYPSVSVAVRKVAETLADAANADLKKINGSSLSIRLATATTTMKRSSR